MFFDGGMGTLLQEKGLKAGEYPERWNITHPHIISGIHKAYFDAGSNVVNTNTYKSIIETDNPSYFIAQDEQGYYSVISKDFQIGNKYTSITYAFDNFFIFTTEDNLYGVIDVYAGLEIAPEYDVIIALENVNALEARKGQTVDIYSKKIEKVLTMHDAVVEAVSKDYVSIYSNTELEYINKQTF